MNEVLWEIEKAAALRIMINLFAWLFAGAAAFALFLN